MAASKLGNWISVSTATTGTGTITLGSKLTGYTAFSDHFTTGDTVYYVIKDGNNREEGIGTYTATGTTLSRDTIISTLVSGTYDDTAPTAITLSGSAIVSCDISKHALYNYRGGWNDIIVPLLGVKLAGVSDPSLSAFGPSGNLRAYSFANSNEIFFNMHIPHDYIQGTTIYPHVHFATNGVSTNNVDWSLEYSFAEGFANDAFPAPTTLNFTQAGAATAWEHQIVEHGTGISGVDIDGVMICRLVRTSATNTDSVFGLFVDFHYESDMNFTNEKDGNFTKTGT